MALTHNLGFPRIGARRELKQALEAYWRGDINDEQLETTAAEIRKRHWLLQRETGIGFNSVLANLYRDGRDRMGWHSDDERELGPRPVIASLSLGACRRFVLRHRREVSSKLAIELPHGSLLVMRGETQRHYRHALPATAKPVGPRINLTFRRIVAS